MTSISTRLPSHRPVVFLVPAIVILKVTGLPTDMTRSTPKRQIQLVRQLQIKALDQLVSWKEEDHPELKQGAANYVRKLRREYDQRFMKAHAHTAQICD